MKGMQGIVIAIALGAVAAFCNWYYMARQSSGYQTVLFLVVDPNVQLNKGDKFKDDHFKAAPVPKQYSGDLEKTAVLWKDKDVIVGQPATRSYRGGEIILYQDTKTPSTRDLSSLLSKDEIAFPVPVDPRSFVPDNFNPGDNISFFVPQYLLTGQPTSVTPGADPPRSEKLIGPFRILALGGRKSTKETDEAAGRGGNREDVLYVAVTLKAGEFDPAGKALAGMLATTAGKGVSVVKHPEKK